MKANLIADLKWAVTRSIIELDKWLRLPRRELPSVTPERFPKVVSSRGHMVAMRDGVRLNTDVYRPAHKPGSEVVDLLIRMPYGIAEPCTYMPAVGRYWARRGYVCVIQDVRGRFGSEGVWVPAVHEREDGFDTIDWAASQPWCDGRVAMTGESYYAFTQWAAASTQHPALACISPGNIGLDNYTLMYEGGALCLGSTAMWSCDQSGRGYLNFYRFDTTHLPVREMSKAAGYSTPFFEEIVTHPKRDDFWADHDHRRLLDFVTVPTLVWSGWYDNLLPGTLQCWEELERRRAAPHLQRLILGPTDHETSSDFDHRIGRIRLPVEDRSWDRVLAFTDEVLGRIPAPSGRTGCRVRAYITGAGRWHEGDTWPPADVAPRRYHLRAAGRLADTPPDTPAILRYDYDPTDAADYWAGKDIWAATRHVRDRRPLHRRPDVLVHSTEPLPEPIDIVGNVAVHLCVGFDAPGTDFTAALIDIAPDGHAQLVKEGIARIGHDGAIATSDNDLLDITIDLGAAGYRFGHSHQIGLEISSSNFDRWDRNLNTGVTPALELHSRISRQRVHLGPDTDSYLLLPVMG